MPYLAIKTNQTLDKDAEKALLGKGSQTVSQLLGKPERYVMLSLDSGVPMMFDASDAPLVYLELKSIGLPENRTQEFSQALCQLMEAELGVTQDRVYIEFASAERHMWGWNGATF